MVLLHREGMTLSTSMVGRILARLRHTGELRGPRRRVSGARHRRPGRPWATRLPKGYRPALPGDLVEVDTLDIRLPGIDRPWKQFTARDRVSRWDTLELAHSATAEAATAILDAIADRMPFAIRAISVDNGAEFMAGFETACRDRAIILLTLPPPEAPAARHGGACQPDPHRGVPRGDRRAARDGTLAAGPARVGARLQHRAPAPGPGLPDASRVPRVAGVAGVTEVPDEYTHLTLRPLMGSISFP